VLAALAVLAVLAGAPLANASIGPASPRLVVVGAPGLAWSDLDGGNLPALDALIRDGALGSMTVRAVGSSSCAVGRSDSGNARNRSPATPKASMSTPEGSWSAHGASGYSLAWYDTASQCVSTSMITSITPFVPRS